MKLSILPSAAKQLRSCLSWVYLLAVGCLFQAPMQAAVLTLDFAQNPALPSAQGMSFYSETGRPESDFASILGSNRLKLDSFSTLTSDRMAYYYKDNIFDHTTDLEMELRIKIINSSPFGFSVGVSNINVSSNFVVNKNGWIVYGVTSGGGYDFSQGFNTFLYKGYGATNTYEFFVNGTRIAFGARPSGYSGNQYFFGDGTPTGGNVSAEVQYIRYSNESFSSGAVPEPVSLASWSLFVGGTILLRRRKSR
ncbi:MAG: hypothetical protein WCP62_15795 [Planctomycetota bacterium]